MRERISLPPDVVRASWNDPAAIAVATTFNKDILLPAIGDAPVLSLTSFVRSMFENSSDDVKARTECVLLPFEAGEEPLFE
jgi:hypothetical protein